jgi:SAM-dependent methyltransferase/methyltransferase-like protein
MTSATGSDLAAIVARTSRSYDALPYRSDPFPHTHPSLIGAIARLFALEAVPLEEARVLELGCAAGGNIIPLAARHPRACFLGIDLSGAQVEGARARIARLKLSNIEIRCQNLSELREQRAFDYVICHGVYSWVAAPLRESILRICRESLAERGVALVSYNVLPGWRMLQALRDCFLLSTSAEAEPHQRAAQARALLRSLPQACPEAGVYKDFLTRAADRLLPMPDEYLAHEFLDDVNEPASFREFVEAARRHGLAYLAEAELPSMIPANYPANMAAMVQQAGGSQLLATEQLIDMASGRTFRHTLLVAAERAPGIDRRLSSARIEGLHIVGASGLALTHEGGGVTLAAPAGRRLHTGSAPLAQALGRLLARLPGSSSVDDLMQALPQGAGDAQARALVREGLLNMVINGLASAHLDPVPAAAKSGAMPLAWAMARTEAAHGAASTVNLRHERVELTEAARFLLPLMDGRRDKSALSAAMAQGAREGSLAFSRNGVAVDDPGERAQIAADQFDTLLPALARAALLLG